MEDKKSSKIRFVRPVDSYNRACWADIIEWMADHISRLVNAFSTHLGHLNQEFKTGGGTS